MVDSENQLWKLNINKPVIVFPRKASFREYYVFVSNAAPAASAAASAAS